jgi:hypothetical protein
MKIAWMWKAFLGALLLVAARPAPVAAQAAGTNLESGARADLVESSWSGPRMGFMFAPGNGSISRRLKDHGLGDVVSEFGWQFERRVAPRGGGPQLVTEAVPLLGGVEYGKLAPSITGLLGLRFPNGFEVGMGPSLTAVSATTINSGLVIAVGKSIDYGSVCIPINLAVSTNNKGTMISLMAGYAIHRTGQ